MPSPRNRLLDRLDHPAWPLVSGVLLALALPPVGWYPLAWVALVPLLVRWSHEQAGWRLFRETYATFLVTAALAGFWVLLHEFVFASLLSGLGLLLVPLPFAGAFVLAAGVRERFGLPSGLVSLGGNLLVVELAQTHGLLPLPWLLLGHTQVDATLFNQIADLGGVGLLTLWVFAVNALVFLTLRTVRTPGPVPGPRTLALLLTVATLTAPAAYGDWRLPGLASPRGAIHVGLVQPAVSAYDWADMTDGPRVDRMAELSERLIAGTGPGQATPAVPVALGARRIGSPAAGYDLLVWPEGAIPIFDDAARQRRLYERLGLWSAMRGVPLLTGAITQASSAPAPTPGSTAGGPQTFFNSALLFAPGAPTQQYDKMRLAPFTERVPFLNDSPVLNRLAMSTTGTASYGTGGRQVLLDAGPVRVGSMIGFESLFGDYARHFTADGADVLVTMAQNGWWGRSPSYEQHLRLSRLRAIESRRAMVFATVNGVSGAIYPDGRIVRAAGWMEERVVGMDVPVGGPTTVYTRYGDWVGRTAGLAAGVLALGWAFAAARAPRPARKRPVRKRR